MELARIRFLVGSYLRTRLRKIETRGVFSNVIDDAMLMPDEAVFLESQKKSVEAHFRVLALRHMPGNLGADVVKRKDDAPSLNDDEACVFVSVEKEARNVAVDDEYVDFEVGSQHVLRFKAVKHLVNDGILRLI